MTDHPNPWRHVVAGMHMGKMTPRPLAQEFDSVLTLAQESGPIEDNLGIRHNHIWLPYIHMDANALDDAVEWAHGQVQCNRKLLVRSEGGRQRPGLVIAMVCLAIGATHMEAISTVRIADHRALTDFRYLDIVTGAAVTA